ncbi:retinoblastoma-binding protein 5 [Cyanistes caeruleus]|uniref:Retinoblastoma-binding protein 5 n=1 Tax=Cyanistes caeruleus TaxID=156563 RepID=A0A8C0V6A0_CYACU|nr:retinoblastoma-binding protein 5 [Cyanistes caeruleus]
MALTCTFNRWGTLLAVGCNDGRIVIWDFLTRGIAKIISAHIHPVCSLCWSRDGHKLVSASTDNIVSQWDVLSGDCDQRFRFPSPILKVQYHPRDQNRVLVCPMKSAPVMLTLSDSKHVVLPVDDDSDLNVVASFDRRGEYIYTGNAKGKILVLKTDTQDLVASFRVTTGTSNTTAIKSIEFARKGSCFLINTADRIIRVYDGREILTCGRDGEPEPMQKLQDLVNRTPWKKCCFSGDGEYIVAGSARQHALYIWEKSIGNLVKILHGTRGELLLDVAWHPVRPIIASISSGVVSIWAQNQVENWSAFAPDFKELDENVEYEERESEFDIEDEDKSEPEQTGADAAEDEEVDVTSVDPIAAFCSSDEELEDSRALLYLPIAPEVEDPEENPYGPPPDALPSALPDEGLGPEKKRPSSSDGPQNPKKKPKTTNIELQGVPNDGGWRIPGIRGWIIPGIQGWIIPGIRGWIIPGIRGPAEPVPRDLGGIQSQGFWGLGKIQSQGFWDLRESPSQGIGRDPIPRVLGFGKDPVPRVLGFERDPIPAVLGLWEGSNPRGSGALGGSPSQGFWGLGKIQSQGSSQGFWGLGKIQSQGFWELGGI